MTKGCACCQKNKRRLHELSGKVNMVYRHIAVLSTLIVGDIVARYVTNK